MPAIALRRSPARRPVRPAAVLLVLLLAAACARNPVTGKRELALISEQQEIALGQQSAQEAEAAMGLVDDPELQQYVERVGMRLAKTSERPNLPWRFRVIDDPTPNAFALPGGFIYVTRGMLSLMQNEAELAVVLGHEIGHVTARHSVTQLSRQQLAQLGLGIGSILSPTVARFGGLAAQGLQLLFLSYGRDDERQSDELGFKYALAHGYDVREAGDPFRSLQRISAQQGASDIPSWASTHPDPGERVATAEQRAAQLPPAQLANATTNTDEYMRRIDGLVYGNDPRNGYFEGAQYYHPSLRFQARFPAGWRTLDTPQAVMAQSPEQDAVMQLTLAQGGATQAAQSFFGQQGLQSAQVTQQRINGLPAVTGLFQAQTEQGVLQGVAAFIEHGGRTFQILGYTPAERFGARDAAFRQMVASFAPLTDASKLNVQPLRLETVRLERAAPLSSVVQATNAVSLEELAILNQVESPSTTLPAGTWVKRVAR